MAHSNIEIAEQHVIDRQESIKALEQQLFEENLDLQFWQRKLTQAKAEEAAR